MNSLPRSHLHTQGSNTHTQQCFPPSREGESGSNSGGGCVWICVRVYMPTHIPIHLNQIQNLKYIWQRVLIKTVPIGWSKRDSRFSN